MVRMVQKFLEGCLLRAISHTPKWRQQPLCEWCLPSGASCWKGAQAQLEQGASSGSQDQVEVMNMLVAWASPCILPQQLPRTT